MKLDLGYFKEELIEEIDNKINRNCDIVSSMIKDNVDDITNDLDYNVDKVNKELKKDITLISNESLHNYILRITTSLYYVYDNLENLGIRCDIAKAVYKDSYNTHFLSLSKGTIEDKKQFAELNSSYEHILKMINDRSYKIINGKIERAIEIINSLKKILSSRMTESEITKFGGSFDTEGINLKNRTW